MKSYLKILPVLLVCLALVACKGPEVKRDEMAAEAPAQAAEETVPESTMVTEEVEPVAEEVEDSSPMAAEAAVLGLENVHFDYDRYFVRETDKEVLKRNARWLKQNSGVNVVIEGHADERGENEYNLALGEKRAMSVKNYLKSLGVSARRLSTISYGEERPADPGHSEAAWFKNRRAEFRVK